MITRVRIGVQQENFDIKRGTFVPIRSWRMLVLIVSLVIVAVRGFVVQFIPA